MEESEISDFKVLYPNYPTSFVGRCVNYQNHYYNLENIKSAHNFFCEPCNKGFYTQGQYQKHIEEHIKCPFPDCDISASLKALDQHIDNQHILVKFESLQIDNESWLNERKKRFPTAQRAELRRAIALEKSKRGERLGKDKKKFTKFSRSNGCNGSASNYKPTSTNNLSKEENFKPKRPNHSIHPVEYKDFKPKRPNHFTHPVDYEDFKPKRSNHSTHPVEHEDLKPKRPNHSTHLVKYEDFKPKRPNHFTHPVEYEDLDDSDSDMKFGIPAFKGTKAFFESTGELPQFGLKQTNSQDEINIDISDEEEWNESANDNVENKTVLHNALGTLIGAYESGEDSDIEPPKNISKHEAVNISKVHQSSDKSIHSKTCHNGRNHNQQKRKFGTKSENFIPTHKRKFNGFKRRPTLLQKLLAPEIVHERNVLLQCIRYIVENNYFSPPNQVDCCMNNSKELK